MSEFRGQPLRFALGTILTITFAWMFDSMDLMLLLILIKSMSHPSQLNFHLLTTGSYIISVALLTSGIGGMVFGYLADRGGRKKFLAISIMTYAIPTLLVAFVQTWIELLLLRLVSGFGVGGAWACGMTLVAETVDPSDRGKAIGIVQCGFPIGFMLAIGLAYFVAYTPNDVVSFGNWRLAFVIGAIPAIILSLVVWFFVPESKIWKFKLCKARKRSIIDVLKVREYRKRFAIGLLLDSLGMFSYWVFWSWLPAYLEKAYQVGSFSMLNNMFWLFATQVGALLGYLTYGFVQDSIGRRLSWTIFNVGEAVLILCSISLIHRIILGEAIDMRLFMVVGFVLGYFTGYWSAFGAVLSELFPTEVRSTASGFIFNIGRSINFISPILVGYIAEIYSFSVALSIAALANIVMAVSIWTLPETKGKNLMEE